MSVTYVGNSNYHQSQGRNINPLYENDTQHRLGVCGGTCGYTGTALNANLYRPYQGWGTIAAHGNGCELELQFAPGRLAGHGVEEPDV